MNLTCAIINGAFGTKAGAAASSEDSSLHKEALLCAVASATIPVAAAVSGTCLGFGFELALACHFMFVTDDALLGFTSPEFTLSQAAISLLHTVCRQQAFAMLLTQPRMTGQEAAATGIAFNTGSSSSLIARARDFLNRLTHNRKPAQIRAVMQSVFNAQNLPADAALLQEAVLFNQLAQTAFINSSSREAIR
jgi:enoyl-CoA hydratase/carnithine racemase